ncbi:Plant non-specific lipid-transfer protein/Par allergen protein [Dioscorea alata]|uniref:Plant non-specific lipid-transfer protein/Par allergen protein n=1 Tax=Dioscorea alata TaxID=55571 RepID=A0ACB7U1D0_DIOAL|nr:Plant non-specific lipid-transfer protein/Par allergen protein [Dioscorea alata]
MEINSGSIRAMTLVIVIMSSVLVTPQVHATLTCNQVYNALKPCISYVLKPNGSVPKPCCDGISGLVKEATTTDDRRMACSCLNSAAKSAGRNVDLGPIGSIPDKCSLSIPFKISADADCSKVN